MPRVYIGRLEVHSRLVSSMVIWGQIDRAYIVASKLMVWERGIIDCTRLLPRLTRSVLQHIDMPQMPALFRPVHKDLLIQHSHSGTALAALSRFIRVLLLATAPAKAESAHCSGEPVRSGLDSRKSSVYEAATATSGR